MNVSQIYFGVLNQGKNELHQGNHKEIQKKNPKHNVIPLIGENNHGQTIKGN